VEAGAFPAQTRLVKQLVEERRVRRAKPQEQGLGQVWRVFLLLTGVLLHLLRRRLRTLWQRSWGQPHSKQSTLGWATPLFSPTFSEEQTSTP
jgi:hypothetical protein